MINKISDILKFVALTKLNFSAFKITLTKCFQTIFDRIQYIRLRMAYISQNIILEGQNNKIELLQKGADPEQLKSLEKETFGKLEEIKEIREFIDKCNEPGEFLDDVCELANVGVI